MSSHTVVALFFLSIFRVVASAPCISFDANFNLLVFGLGSKDYNAGTQDSWSTNNSPAEITTSGRPPFNGATPSCFLSQFENAIYVVNADTSQPSSVYIYDAGAKSWSMQSTTPNGFEFTPFNAILDHDTNVFYALSQGSLFYLDMGALKSANASALPWVDAATAGFTTTNYNPVMALAQNHIYFLDVPGVPAGSADIFVIHYSYFQPQSQAYPINGGGNVPATHGQTASFFQASGVQQEFAFIPDDGSATYVLNVETNTTQSLAGPSRKDSNATYYASITALVQLDSKGVISYLPYNENDTTANQAATWSIINSLESLIPSSTTTAGSGTTAGSKTSTNGGATSTGSSGTSSSGAVLVQQYSGLSVVLTLFGMAALVL